MHALQALYWGASHSSPRIASSGEFSHAKFCNSCHSDWHISCNVIFSKFIQVIVSISTFPFFKILSINSCVIAWIWNTAQRSCVKRFSVQHGTMGNSINFRREMYWPFSMSLERVPCHSSLFTSWSS